MCVGWGGGGLINLAVWLKPRDLRGEFVTEFSFSGMGSSLQRGMVHKPVFVALGTA